MPDLVAELASHHRSLPVEERSRLVDLLLESLHESPIAEVEAAWTKRNRTAPRRTELGEVETSPLKMASPKHATKRREPSPLQSGGSSGVLWPRPPTYETFRGLGATVPHRDRKALPNSLPRSHFTSKPGSRRNKRQPFVADFPGASSSPQTDFGIRYSIHAVAGDHQFEYWLGRVRRNDGCVPFAQPDTPRFATLAARRCVHHPPSRPGAMPQPSVSFKR